MSSATALSSTVWLTTPSIAIPPTNSPSGASDTRPRVALRPTRPQHDAGMRIEPPPSLACAIGTMPEATAPALPPDEPPVVREGSQGLRAGPKRSGSVTGKMPSSGVLVLPTMIAPASRRRRTSVLSSSGTQSPIAFMPIAQRIPLVSATRSLTAIGTPASGRSSPGSIASASASARSSQSVTNALSSSLRRSIASYAVSTSSRAVISPSCTIEASSTAGRNIKSLAI